MGRGRELATHEGRFRVDAPGPTATACEPIDPATPLDQAALWHEVAAIPPRRRHGPRRPGHLDPAGSSTGVRVETVGALADALAAARTATGLTLVQAVVPQDDVPPVLAEVAAAAANSGS